MEFPKKEILMAYVSGSCDFPKSKNGEMAYISGHVTFPKRKFLMAYISAPHFCSAKNYQKRKF
jgi:hypothetical protein